MVQAAAKSVEVTVKACGDPLCPCAQVSLKLKHQNMPHSLLGKAKRAIAHGLLSTSTKLVCQGHARTDTALQKPFYNSKEVREQDRLDNLEERSKCHPDDLWKFPRTLEEREEKERRIQAIDNAAPVSFWGDDEPLQWVSSTHPQFIMTPVERALPNESQAGLESDGKANNSASVSIAKFLFGRLFKNARKTYCNEFTTESPIETDAVFQEAARPVDMDLLSFPHPPFNLDLVSDDEAESTLFVPGKPCILSNSTEKRRISDIIFDTTASSVSTIFSTASETTATTADISACSNSTPSPASASTSLPSTGESPASTNTSLPSSSPASGTKSLPTTNLRDGNSSGRRPQTSRSLHSHFSSTVLSSTSSSVPKEDRPRPLWTGNYMMSDEERAQIRAAKKQAIEDEKLAVEQAAAKEAADEAAARAREWAELVKAEALDEYGRKASWYLYVNADEYIAPLFQDRPCTAPVVSLAYMQRQRVMETIWEYREYYMTDEDDEDEEFDPSIYTLELVDLYATQVALQDSA